MNGRKHHTSRNPASFFAKRTGKAMQGMGYGLTTVGAGVGTLALGTVTLGLAMTVVGIPVALLTGAGTAGCGIGTWKAAKRTGHKFVRAFEADDQYTYYDSGKYMGVLSSKKKGALVNPDMIKSSIVPEIIENGDKRPSLEEWSAPRMGR